MKKIVSIKIDPDTHERIMRIVYWTPGLTFSGIVRKLVEEFVEKLEGERGSKFPERPRK